ncbi:MAG: heparinase II/III family protein, partial [Armatimonadetes bacterium]|nr:heparinase II/III family protein [Armatimonadota bacterium]
MVLVPVLLGSTLGSLWAQPRVVTAGLPNLALSARAEATSSASSTYSADRATDGDLNTRWASDRYPSLPQTLTITFGEPITFTTVLILPVDMPSLYAWCKKVRVRAGEQTAEAEAGEGYQPILLRFEKPVTSSQVAVDIVQVHEPRDYVGIAEIMIFNDPEGKVRVLADWREEWLKADRTPHGRPVHPCVYITPEDVAYARELVKREAWAAKYLERVMKQAEEWLARSDEWIYTHTPPKGACFAYGVTGCPICGASFGTWLGARCSWDNPGHVVCENGHVLPDNEHPDPGTGYKAPDGRIHYFVGAYNAWVVEQYAFRGAANLAMAYTLTGDERYAQKCAVILDALADIYPTCTKGSWDYPSDPPSGRLNRPWYQVARVLVEYVDWYDRIFNSPALDTPSIRQGLTKRQNIEQNLLIDGAEYCYQCSLDRGKMGMALHNGCADYIRGALAVGCCLGIDTYVRWALDGPFGIRSLLANNVDRDGRYYETSVSYAEHTRGLYLTYAEPLLNYRSSEHPNGVDIYSWPHFSRFYRAPAAAIACAGHTPSFGDSAPDLSWAPADAPPISQEDVNHLLRAARSSAAEELLPLLGYLLGPRVPDFCSQYADPELLLFRSGLWRRLSALPGRTDDTQIGARTALFGQKGIAILRAGRGSAQQALLLRYGPSLNHGHFDDLGFNYYALGYELTYDLGYSMGSPHVQVGWAKQTAAHNLVVVNERPQGVAPGSGGSIFYLADLPGLQLVEADSPLSYSSEDVTVYRRCLALIGEPPDCYLLDIFRVGGGTQHDYFFHALSDKAEFSGLQLSDPQPGSLAGPDIRWADKVGNDGDIRGYPGKPYWNPPPGNGYGFLADVQKATTVGAQPWHVTWPIASSSARLTMTAAVDSETEILTAWAPGIRPRL